VVFFEFYGFLEEGFGGDCEEFGGVGRGVIVEHGFPIALYIFEEPGVVIREDFLPSGVEASFIEDGNAVGFSVFVVELVREFVDDHVVTVVLMSETAQDFFPGEDDDADVP